MAITKRVKHDCVCQHCGNEAEMELECTLPDELDDDDEPVKAEAGTKKKTIKVKGTGTCVSCGNEADMWIDFEA